MMFLAQSGQESHLQLMLSHMTKTSNLTHFSSFEVEVSLKWSFYLLPIHIWTNHFFLYLLSQSLIEKMNVKHVNIQTS